MRKVRWDTTRRVMQQSQPRLGGVLGECLTRVIVPWLLTDPAPDSWRRTAQVHS
jgi:hypothetical protein